MTAAAVFWPVVRGGPRGTDPAVTAYPFGAGIGGHRWPLSARLSLRYV
jgi:hypothetical protein